MFLICKQKTAYDLRISDLSSDVCSSDRGIHGEEFGVHIPGAEFVWVLDPIDGTKSFISGNPLFGSLVALLQGGRPILGVIDMPILEERWVGAEIGRAHV